MTQRIAVCFCGLALVLLCVGFVSSPACADAPVELVWPDGAPGAVGDNPETDKPTLTIYALPKEKASGTAVLVCPGGGYGFVAMDHEGHQVAQWFNSIGISAFILNYRHAPTYHYPAPIDDAKRAMRIVRSRADQYGIDPNRIGIMGFSAGGHLASSIGTHFDKGAANADDPIERVSCRPDFMILVYPVISFTDDAIAHKGARKNLLGETMNYDLVKLFSNENQVTKETPPTFLMHTSGDTGVPAENSVQFYLALRRAGVPAELHIYEKGRHGFGLASTDPILSSWPKRCEDWLKGRGLLQN